VLDEQALFHDLAGIGLADWRDTLAPLIRERLADGAHGDLVAWKDVIGKLPPAAESSVSTDGTAVVISTGAGSPGATRALLKRLTPWRKGPFRIDGIEVDAEWRSDLKWNRIADAIQPLDNRNVLDVGCGNGYYALRMHCAGADRVIGIDPTVLFVCQFLALQKLSGVSGIHVLPLRLH